LGRRSKNRVNCVSRALRRRYYDKNFKAASEVQALPGALLDGRGFIASAPGDGRGDSGRAGDAELGGALGGFQFAVKHTRYHRIFPVAARDSCTVGGSCFDAASGVVYAVQGSVAHARCPPAADGSHVRSSAPGRSTTLRKTVTLAASFVVVAQGWGVAPWSDRAGG